MEVQYTGERNIKSSWRRAVFIFIVLTYPQITNGAVSISSLPADPYINQEFVLTCTITPSFTSTATWAKDSTTQATCSSSFCTSNKTDIFFTYSSSGLTVIFKPVTAAHGGLWKCTHSSGSADYNVSPQQATRLGSSIDEARTVYTVAVMTSENVIMTDISSYVIKNTTVEIARTFDTALLFTGSEYILYSSRFHSSDLISNTVSTQFLSPALSGLSGLIFYNTLMERPLITTVYSTVDLVVSSALASEFRTTESTTHVSNLQTDFSVIYSTLERKYVTRENISYLTHSSSIVSSDVDISFTTFTKHSSTLTKELVSSFTNIPAFNIMQSTIGSEVIITNTRNRQSDIVPSSTTFKLNMLSTIINSTTSTLLHETSLHLDLGLYNATRQIFSATSPETNLFVSTIRESLQTYYEKFFTSNPFAVSSSIYRPTISQNTEQTSFNSVTASSVFLTIESAGIWNLHLTGSGSSLFVEPPHTFRTSSVDSGLFNNNFTSEFASVSRQLSTVATSSERNIISVSTIRQSLQTRFEISFTSDAFSVSSTSYRQTITQNSEEISFSSMTASSVFAETESPEVLNLHLTSSGSSFFLQPSYTLSNAFRSQSALYSVEDKLRQSGVFPTTETQDITVPQVLLSTTTQPTAARVSGLSSENIIIISSSVAGGLVTVLFIILITLYIYNKLERKQSNKKNNNQDDDKHDNIYDPSTYRVSDYPYMYTGIPLRLNCLSQIPYSHEYNCDYERNWKNA